MTYLDRLTAQENQDNTSRQFGTAASVRGAAAEIKFGSKVWPREDETSSNVGRQAGGLTRVVRRAKAELVKGNIL